MALRKSLQNPKTLKESHYFRDAPLEHPSSVARENDATDISTDRSADDLTPRTAIRGSSARASHFPASSKESSSQKDNTEAKILPELKILSEDDRRVQDAFYFFQKTVHELQIAESKSSTALSSTIVQQFNTCLNQLKSTEQQLKSKKRPKEELAACHYLLASLHCRCPLLYKKSDRRRNDITRILSGIMHSANAISFAKTSQEPLFKNTLIVQSLTLLTWFFGEPQALAALEALPPERKIDLLTKLRGHISEGLAHLTATSDLSQSDISAYQRLTKPLLDAISNLAHPPEPTRAPVVLCKISLTLLGALLGSHLSQTTDSSGLEMLMLPALTATCGSQLGEVIDTQLTKNLQAPRSSLSHFSLFKNLKNPLAVVGGALGLYLGLSSGTLLPSIALSLANTSFLTVLWGACGYRAGETLDVQVEKYQQGRQPKVS